MQRYSANAPLGDPIIVVLVVGTGAVVVVVSGAWLVLVVGAGWVVVDDPG
jgi:hypothetical protein